MNWVAQMVPGIPGQTSQDSRSPYSRGEEKSAHRIYSRPCARAGYQVYLLIRCRRIRGISLLHNPVKPVYIFTGFRIIKYNFAIDHASPRVGQDHPLRKVRRPLHSEVVVVGIRGRRQHLPGVYACRRCSLLPFRCGVLPPPRVVLTGVEPCLTAGGLQARLLLPACNRGPDKDGTPLAGCS